MQDHSRKDSASSQARRSSRSSTRKASNLGLPQGDRLGSRRGSTPKEPLHLNFDDPNVDWSGSEFWKTLADNGDATDAALALNAFPTQDNYHFNLGIHPESVRASFDLLQNPYSAFPGTPHAIGFNPLAPYAHAPLAPYAPQMTSVSPYLAQTFLNPHHVQSSRHTGIEGQRTEDGKRSSPRTKRSISEPPPGVPVHAPLFLDEFAGYPGHKPDYAYPDPIDPRFLGGPGGPYYPNEQHLQQNGDAFSPTHAVPYPGTEHNKRRRSMSQGTEDNRPRKKTRSNPSSTGRSDSTYPDRSRSGSASSPDRRLSRLQMQKRKSVMEDRFKLERPKADPDKAWIRTNTTTRGKTTRTAKLNHYDPSEHYTQAPHPLGNWKSKRTGQIFKYTRDGEWKEKTMTASQIYDFIMNYPEDEKRGIKLMLYIQVGPTDSARRYLSQTWSKCRFHECPANQHQTGTILHGHYRVAFDERSFGDRNYDPHLAAGAYVHLYCLERFLDLEKLCRKAHIHVDTRTLTGEPKGKFAATLSGHPECGIAEAFVSCAKDKMVRKLDGFEDYPYHADYDGEPKPHKDTLVYKMHNYKTATRPPAQKKQFLDRGLKPTHLLVNQGDLEVLFNAVVKANRKKAMVKSRKRKAKDLDDDTEDEDEEEEEEDEGHRLVAMARKTYSSSAKKVTKRARKLPSSPSPWEEDDEDSEDDEAIFITDESRTPPTRCSKRNAGRKRPDYSELSDPAKQQLSPGTSRKAPEGYQPASAYIADISESPRSQRNAHIAAAQLASPRRRSSKFVDPNLEGLDFDAFFDGQGLYLDRRASTISASTRAGSIMRLPGSRYGSLSKRQASFAAQPVSRKQTFDSEAPPSAVQPRFTRQTRQRKEEKIVPGKTRKRDTRAYD